MISIRKLLKKTVTLAAAAALGLSCFAVSAFAQTSSDSTAAENENCTGIYVGKKVSQDGTTIIARCADTHPLTVSQYLNIQDAVSGEPGRFATGSNGFCWELPESTYRYISVPRPAMLGKGNSWDSAAMNERGLAVTATVSSYINKEARKWDPYVADGLTEDNIAGIIVATCSGAKEAVQRIAQILDTQGAAESNIFMVIDRDEAWYMEIYSGHQYAAVKMPEDKVAVFGNEFMLDTLDGFEDTVVSAELTALPEKHGAAVWHDGSFDPFASYVGTDSLLDYCNLRTWRGHMLFAPSTVGDYETHTKYPLFFDPEHKISDADIISLLRDRMEGVCSEEELKEGNTRIIGTETAAHAHLLKVHSDYPEQMAVEMWLCMSNAAYAPFVPLSNAVTAADEHYTHILQEYRLDERSASHIYKKLNALAAQNRERYGLGVESCWQDWEATARKKTKSILEKAKELYQNGENGQAEKLLTDFSTSLQTAALSDAQRIFDELIWYMAETTDSYPYVFSYETLEDTPSDATPFSPNVPLEDYARAYGWTVEESADGFLLTRDGRQLIIRPADGMRLSPATILADGKEEPISARQLEAGTYIRHSDAVKYLRENN